MMEGTDSGQKELYQCKVWLEEELIQLQQARNEKSTCELKQGELQATVEKLNK